MQFTRLILAGAIAFAACSGDAGGGSDEVASGSDRVHVVRMLFDGARYYFDPVDLTIQQGDTVRWIMVSGAPHNVAFLPAEIPTGAETQLAANMPRTDAPLTGPMLLSENEEYVVPFTNVPPGRYGYVCTPHQMVGMKATITVE